jgi:feruloyl esterase
LTPPNRIDLADLVRRSRRLDAAGQGGEGAAASRLETIEAFGPNPGALRLRAFVPEGLPPGGPLLVALHGCTQTAAGFDRGCGWSTLAEAHGFALLMPEQRQANNANRCFHWFEPAHASRGAGETGSILAMVRHMLAAHRLDPARVGVVGLSAGGAMAGSLLATHPEVFAAGAVIAGLPHGAAAGMPQAFEAMATGGRPRPDEAWAEAVRQAADPGHAGPWPRIAIWHGEADSTVHPANGEALVRQWTRVHAVAAAETEALPGGGRRRVWRGDDGAAVVEHHSLPGVAHGVPIHAGTGEGRSGEAMPFILDVGVSAPHRILGFLGMASDAPRPQRAAAAAEGGGPGRAVSIGVVTVAPDGQARIGVAAEAAEPEGAAGTPSAGRDPGAVIRRALAAAGLLRS